jgi:hypothetical protein
MFLSYATNNIIFQHEQNRKVQLSQAMSLLQNRIDLLNSADTSKLHPNTDF